MQNLNGHSLGRYRIAEKIGEGGMGVVYRAHDTRLDRDVAIKVLPEPSANHPSRIERFKREARAVARLSHPNILEIHDFGEDGNHSYAVMELLDGVDLRRKIQSGRIPVRKAVQIAQQAADGLGAAHRAGVIHRDIKPENLFLTRDGRLKILDFGLAHLKDPVESGVNPSATTDILTGKGTVLGTPQYMSPEQIRGQKVDTASDIFSLGCVIYEMIGGVHPFVRDTSADTLSAILAEDPEPLTATAPDLPFAVDELILRCLEKDAADRLESARDLAFALEAINESRSVSGRVLRRPPLWTRRGFRIAVGSAAIGALAILGGQALINHLTAPPSLPHELHVGVPAFEIDSDDEELMQLTAGLSRSVAEDLEALEPEADGRMWVVSQAAARDEGAADGCADLHRVFNVSICLEGRLRKSGDRLSLDLEVIDPISGVSLGSRTIEDDWGNLAFFQTAPVREAAELLGLEIDAQFAQLLDRSATTVTPALAAYLRGSGVLLDADDADKARAAVDLLKAATESDPLHSAAWSRLGAAYLRLFRHTDDRTWLESGLNAATRAVDRNPTARSYAVLSSLRARGDDADGQIEAMEQAVALEPRNAEAHYRLSLAYKDARRSDDAEHALQRAINLRTDYWPYHHELALLHLRSAAYDAAANQWRQVIRCAPDLDVGYSNLGIALWYLGDEEAVERALLHAIELAPDDSYSTYSNLGTLYFGQARYADATAMYEKALAEYDGDYMVWGNLGFAQIQSADPTLATEPLHRAIALAEATLLNRPDDLVLLTDLASYHATLGAKDQTIDYLERAVVLEPSDPADMVEIGEAYLDIGRRDEAATWIRRALVSGMPEERLMARPKLRELIDETRPGSAGTTPLDGA